MIKNKQYQKNVGSTDKIVRIVAAFILAVLYFKCTFTGTLSIVLGAVAIMHLATSIINFCPLYSLLDVNSCEIKTS